MAKTKKITPANEEISPKVQPVEKVVKSSVAPIPKAKENIEETDSSTVAIIVAIVAIIIIAGSVGAFFLFMKVKKNYVEPFMKSQAGTAPPTSLLPQDDGSGNIIIPAGTEPIGIGESDPVTPDLPIPPSVPDFPDEPPVIPPVPDVPEIPESEKVGSFDFDGAIAEMDGAINNTFDTTFNNTIYSNDYFGFD